MGTGSAPDVPGLRLIGRLNDEGGQADVFLAAREDDGEEVALRLFRQPMSSERDRHRYAHEVGALATLSGLPYLAAIHEFGVTTGGRPYLVMDFCPHGSLADHLATVGRLTPKETRAVGIKVANALAHAHRRDIIHRAISPTNILIDGRGHPLLSDFRLVSLDTPGGDYSAPYDADDSPYAAPEAFLPELITPVADVYSLAATLRRLLIGIEPRRRPLGSMPLVDILVKATALDPDDRYQSAEQFADALEGLELVTRESLPLPRRLDAAAPPSLSATAAPAPAAPAAAAASASASAVKEKPRWDTLRAIGRAPVASAAPPEQAVPEPPEVEEYEAEEGHVADLSFAAVRDYLVEREAEPAADRAVPVAERAGPAADRAESADRDAGPGSDRSGVGPGVDPWPDAGVAVADDDDADLDRDLGLDRDSGSDRLGQDRDFGPEPDAGSEPRAGRGGFGPTAPPDPEPARSGDSVRLLVGTGVHFGPALAGTLLWAVVAALFPAVMWGSLWSVGCAVGGMAALCLAYLGKLWPTGVAVVATLVMSWFVGTGTLGTSWRIAAGAVLIAACAALARWRYTTSRTTDRMVGPEATRRVGDLGDLAVPLAPLAGMPGVRVFALGKGGSDCAVVAGRRVALLRRTAWPADEYRYDIRKGAILKSNHAWNAWEQDCGRAEEDAGRWRSALPKRAKVKAFLVVRTVVPPDADPEEFGEVPTVLTTVVATVTPVTAARAVAAHLMLDYSTVDIGVCAPFLVAAERAVGRQDRPGQHKR